MTYQTLRLEVKERVAWIVFDRAGQLNAMNALMMNEIISALTYVNSAPSEKIGACVLTGEGRAFMAGADLKEYARQSNSEFDAFQTKGRDLYAAIEGNAKPVVAAVNGYAFGGGFEIALACDMIIASQWAKFALPEILLALIPGGGGTQRLPMKLGRNLANELLMTGKTVNAQWLLERGVVNQVVDKKDDFNHQVSAFVSQLTEMQADRLQAIKLLTGAAAGNLQHSQLYAEGLFLGQFYRSQESKEKLQAFMQK